MSSTSTKIGDIINPKVMGDIIEAKIIAQAKLTPYAKVDTTLQGVPGDTITVPAWNYIGDAEDFNVETAYDNNTEMETTKLTAGSTNFKVKCAGKSVSVLQTAVNSGLGDPVGQANIQLAKAINSKIDNDLLSAIYDGATTVYNGSANKISYSGIVAGVTKFLDEEDGIDKVMFIHPEQLETLLNDSNFISADKFAPGVAVTGAIGKVANCWIKKSKKVAKQNAVEAVAGVYKIVVGGTVAEGDKITVNGTTVTLDSTSGASASAAAGAVRTALGSDTIYTVSGSGANVILTEKSGKEGTGFPEYSIVSTAGTLTPTTTTKGVAATEACYKDVIIKIAPDSVETDYTEEELPALTIYLKKGLELDHEYFPKKQRHDFTATEYYGAALTNASKVVVALFKQ